ncbi:MAG: peptidoglycan-binding protein [Oscillospiraceae bacterium]|nr:peptidoglycan-binding protein [Oscillospiraceae bacterium]
MGSREKIYSVLRGAGLTRAGALGLMGNWDCESNLEAGRVQGDFSPYRTGSKLYVSQITSGVISKEQFMKDAKGFGLAQWTYFTRKGKLYNYWRNSGVALDDAEMQTRFALYELSTGGEYSGLYSFLRSSEDLRACVEKVCTIYERPAVNNIDARYSAAQRLAAEIPDGAGDVNTDPGEETPADGQQSGSEETPKVGSPFWPPRGYYGGYQDPGLCRGMSGKDVKLMRSLLEIRGYDVTGGEEFDEQTEKALVQFQSNQNLAADGICGKNSWHALLTA